MSERFVELTLEQAEDIVSALRLAPIIGYAQVRQKANGELHPVIVKADKWVPASG